MYHTNYVRAPSAYFGKCILSLPPGMGPIPRGSMVEKLVLDFSSYTLRQRFHNHLRKEK